MSRLRNDIDDNEIRIISKIESSRNSMSYMPEHDDEDDCIGFDQEIVENKSSLRGCLPDDRPIGQGKRKGKGKRTAVVAAIAAIAIVAVVAVTAALLFAQRENDEILKLTSEKPATTAPAQTETVLEERAPIEQPSAAFTERTDTTAGGVRLTILTPREAVPTLETGLATLEDSTIVLAAQAADIRADNGRIVCAFVKRGELLSKGEAKAGFCAIINGELTIGVADATPMLEQALSTDGYFFRQYPLVVAGQAVENKPKGKAQRRALAEKDGTTSIVVSPDRLTFGEFSQALIDAGFRNAIYLTGSESQLLFRDKEGNVTTRHTDDITDSPNVNYIVWR